MENVWRDLVECVLLQILEELPYSSILSAGLVCQRWHRLSLDDLLWKAVLTKHFNAIPPVTLRPGAVSWRKEFIRMLDHVPCVETEKVEYHTDEVVHVAYAHSKEMFSVCSKDGKATVWQASHPCTLMSVLDGHWKAPFNSTFNFSDSLLSVNGMIDDWNGVIAIYKIGESDSDPFTLLSLMGNSLYDKIDNGWVTDTTFLSTVQDTGVADVRTSVYLNSLDNSNIELKKLYDIDENLSSRCISTIRTHEVDDPSLLFSCGNMSLEDDHWSLAPTRMGLIEKRKNSGTTTIDIDDVKLFSPSTPDNPHMYISGHCLDPDEKVCYLNVRPLTPTRENENGAFDTNENLQLLPLELSTMTTGPPLTGHKGYASVEADCFTLNCIYPDVTRDYVGCGSEDNRGYLWDRHYGCLVFVVSGHTKPVCGVAIDPTRQDVMVTVGDDHHMRIFRTKKWCRENIL